MKFFLSIAFILLINLPAFSNDTQTAAEPVKDTLLYRGDSLLIEITPVTDPIDYESRLVQQPTKALLKSMIVPGWGQLGNKKYIKALFFAGMDIWMVASAVHYGRQASDFKEKYEQTEIVSLRNEYYDLYLDRKDERNKFTWFAVIISFVSMFDAYVDAHLSGYPKKKESSDLTFDITPTLNDGFNFQLAYSF